MENAGLVDPDTGSRADHTLKLHCSVHVLLEPPVSRQIGVTLWGLRNHCVEWGLRNHCVEWGLHNHCNYVITALLVGNFLEIRYTDISGHTSFTFSQCVCTLYKNLFYNC